MQKKSRQDPQQPNTEVQLQLLQVSLRISFSSLLLGVVFHFFCGYRQVFPCTIIVEQTSYCCQLLHLYSLCSELVRMYDICSEHSFCLFILKALDNRNGIHTYSLETYKDWFHNFHNCDAKCKCIDAARQLCC